MATKRKGCGKGTRRIKGGGICGSTAAVKGQQCDPPPPKTAAERTAARGAKKEEKEADIMHFNTNQFKRDFNASSIEGTKGIEDFLKTTIRNLDTKIRRIILLKEKYSGELRLSAKNKKISRDTLLSIAKKIITLQHQHEKLLTIQVDIKEILRKLTLKQITNNAAGLTDLISKIGKNANSSRIRATPAAGVGATSTNATTLEKNAEKLIRNAEALVQQVTGKFNNAATKVTATANRINAAANEMNAAAGISPVNIGPRPTNNANADRILDRLFGEPKPSAEETAELNRQLDEIETRRGQRPAGAALEPPSDLDRYIEQLRARATQSNNNASNNNANSLGADITLFNNASNDEEAKRIVAQAVSEINLSNPTTVAALRRRLNALKGKKAGGTRRLKRRRS